MLFSNKGLFKDTLSAYNSIIYVPVTVSDKLFWSNIFKVNKTNLEKLKFNW